jgi:hypothetical protein
MAVRKARAKATILRVAMGMVTVMVRANGAVAVLGMVAVRTARAVAKTAVVKMAVGMAMVDVAVSVDVTVAMMLAMVAGTTILVVFAMQIFVRYLEAF